MTTIFLWRPVAALCGALLLLTGARAQPEAVDAVIGIEATVPAAARSAAFLGTVRRGSGVVIDAGGLVVTVGYLILEASRVQLVGHDGVRVAASVIGYDPDSGLGLLRAARPLPAAPLAFGRPAELRERDPALVVAYDGAARPATVVSRRDYAGYWEYLLEDAIFIVPPYPSFAGAALLDGEGRLLGIGSLAVGDAFRDRDMIVPGNMFIPIDRLEPVIAELLSRGRVATAKPWLGLYAEQRGDYLFVTRLAEDGPAAAAGLRAGELIVGVGGRPAATLGELYRLIWASGEAGVGVPLTVLRGGELVDIEVISRDRYDWLRLTPAV